MDAMEELGFVRLIEAPKDILGKSLTLLHWSGATERETLHTVDDAKMALEGGWTRYRIETQ
jgi:hypothetical protein